MCHGYTHLNKISSEIPRGPTDTHSQPTCFFKNPLYAITDDLDNETENYHHLNLKEVTCAYLIPCCYYKANYAHTSVTYVHEDFDK